MTRRSVHLAVAAAVAIVWACTTQDPGSGTKMVPGGEVVGEVLESVAHEAIAPSFAAFAIAASDLETATAALAAAPDDPDAIAVARAAFGAAAQTWQIVEVMQLGPAGSSAVAIGGADLRDEVYSWPAVNTCRVDQELVLGEYGAPDFTETRLVNAYGLDALEYLLFVESPDNTCAPQLPINQGEWAALGDEEVTRRRAAYAAAIASAVAAVGKELADAWNGDFAEHLADPTAPGSPYGSEAAAMDELLRAMFYIDKVLKDQKLARPAGILDCSTATCPETVESPWSATSKEHVLANLEGFRRIFVGGIDADAATGFDDLLAAIGEEAFAEEILTDIEAAVAAVEAIDGSFQEALAADESALDAAHVAVRNLTDALKGHVSTVLMLTIPAEAAGDAD